MKRFLLYASICLLFAGFNFRDSNAIPAFARKYSISCRTCHSPSAPKLKPYGDDFAGDGFKLQDYDAPRYFIETGDPKLNLMRNFPLAVRIDGFITYNNSSNEKSDFGAPYSLKILSGSEISEHLAYYFYFYMSEHGEIAGVEDAYLMYDNLFNTELDIMLGQFQVSDPLFKRELRLSLEDYHVYTPQIGISDITMKYDKGVMMTYGFPTGTDIIFEIVNGNGITEADPWKIFDKDKYKNFAGRISQNIGDYFRIGVFGYYGNEEQVNDENTVIKNTATFAGADASISVNEIFELNFQYLLRNDEVIYPDPAATTTLNDLNTHGYLGEVIYSPQGDDSDWYALGMLNWVESDFSPANYRSASLHLGYLLQRNVRLAAEYTWDFSNSDNQFGRASMGFVTAF